MATTAFNTPRAETLRAAAKRPAASGFAAHLAALRTRWRANAEKRALARFAGTRWCDATEREIIDALSKDERGLVLS
jgi:hypothetical protein